MAGEHPVIDLHHRYGYGAVSVTSSDLPMTRLCLNMIVKNEGARILRALESVAPFIDYWVIHDTGSTDDTVAKIEHFFDVVRVPGCISTGTFKNFAQARNDALRSARARAGVGAFDYILLMDADMELVVRDRRCFETLRGPSCDMFQTGGTMHYINRRIVRADITNEYRGVTHEYLDCEAAYCIGKEHAFFQDYADGANRPDKWKRDVKLLLQGLKDEPNMAQRYTFYLAQSYKDGGEFKKAIRAFEKRISLGGWDEEVWYSQYMLADTYRKMGDEPKFIAGMIKAYQMRPSRVEPLYALARMYRDRGENHASLIFGETIAQMPPSKDGLFVDDYMEKVGRLEELAICGYYSDRARPKGFAANDRVSLLRNPYSGTRELARRNMYWYLQPLRAFCPSYMSAPISFTPPANWRCLNPSVTIHHGGLHCVVRTVNYRIDDDGRYWIGEKWPDDQNPITTRNFLTKLEDDFTVAVNHELKPTSMPEPNYKAVMGFEDMRLFSLDGQLYTSSTVRQMAGDGLPEQVLARIDGTSLVNIQKMLREPRECEKNWMPIVDFNGASCSYALHFMYRLGEIVDVDGKTISKIDTGLETQHISGGSQVIRWSEGWIALVHEARPLPDKGHKRYYYHRFAFFDKQLRFSHLSPPFVFQQNQIEFAAGLCKHPVEDKFVISFGVRDEEAWIATVDIKEVRNLCSISKW